MQRLSKIKRILKMSRCKCCDNQMKRSDWQNYKGDGTEEDLCLSCRQEIFKHDDKCVTLGFSLEEIDMMKEGFFVDYRHGKLDE